LPQHLQLGHAVGTHYNPHRKAGLILLQRPVAPQSGLVQRKISEPINCNTIVRPVMHLIRQSFEFNLC